MRGCFVFGLALQIVTLRIKEPSSPSFGVMADDLRPPDSTIEVPPAAHLSFWVVIRWGDFRIEDLQIVTSFSNRISLYLCRICFYFVRCFICAARPRGCDARCLGCDASPLLWAHSALRYEHGVVRLYVDVVRSDAEVVRYRTIRTTFRAYCL